MNIKKAVGPGSAARKYDVLTVLGSYALSQDRNVQRLVLRLVCLITARYNWQHDQLSVAQTEIAKLWSCDPRTVKREMASLRQRKWLIEERASGKGRATVYRLGVTQIFTDTREVWDNLGRDLVDRLAPVPQPAPTPESAEEKVIPFPQPHGATFAPASDCALWGLVAQRLHGEDQAVFRAWFADLTAHLGEDSLELVAPSRFHARYVETHMRGRIERHLQAVAPGLRLVLS